MVANMVSRAPERTGEERPHAVVVFGQKQKTSRLGPQENLVFSDGAASCLVTADGGTFEFLAGESITNTELATMGRGGNIAQFQNGLMELRSIKASISARADWMAPLISSSVTVSRLRMRQSSRMIRLP